MGPAVQVQVVGVVEDVRQRAVERAPYSEIFMDYRQVRDQQEKRKRVPAVDESVPLEVPSPVTV